MGFALSGIKMEKIADAVSNSFPHTHSHTHAHVDTYRHTHTHTLGGGKLASGAVYRAGSIILRLNR